LCRAAGLVEVLEVDRGHPGEFFDLPFAEPLPGRALDRLDRVIEAAAGTFQCGQLAQPVRVTLGRQIQPGVGRVQVPDPRRPVGQPLDLDLAEHRLQRAGVSGLHPAAQDALITGHLLQARLAHGPQREMIIKQPPQQLPPVAVKMILELPM